MDNNQTINSSKEAGLFIVSTPIGNLGDMSFRAVNVLKAADLVLCEDTRETKKLLNHFGINARTEAYHDHNGAEKRPEVLNLLKEGKMVALVSDAGTPLVSDPGYKLVHEAREAGHKVYPVPGASSILAALVMSGMPSDSFTFCGFAEKKKYEKFASFDSTLIFFESARRVADTLKEMEKYFGWRSVCICREITKLYEEAISGNFAELSEKFSANTPKGEIVILLSPPGKQEENYDSITSELKELLTKLKLKEAAEILGEKYRLNKKKIYELGLKLK